MKKDINTLYCTTCGSDKAQSRACVEVNTNKFCSDTDEGSAYCPDCEDECGLETLLDLSQSFSHIATDDNGRITEKFICFQEGSLKSDVINWFMERCPDKLTLTF